MLSFRNQFHQNKPLYIMKTKTSALIFGSLFLLIGILGFIPNPIVGVTGDYIFHADTLHSIIHIVSGLLFFFFALAMPDNAPAFMKVFGGFYFLLGVIGLLMVGASGEGMVLGFLHVNGADNFLHIVLGALIFLAGLAKTQPTIIA